MQLWFVLRSCCGGTQIISLRCSTSLQPLSWQVQWQEEDFLPAYKIHRRLFQSKRIWNDAQQSNTTKLFISPEWACHGHEPLQLFTFQKSKEQAESHDLAFTSYNSSLLLFFRQWQVKLGLLSDGKFTLLQRQIHLYSVNPNRWTIWRRLDQKSQSGKDMTSFSALTSS